jgi:hypothetical protein
MGTGGNGLFFERAYIFCSAGFRIFDSRAQRLRIEQFVQRCRTGVCIDRASAGHPSAGHPSAGHPSAGPRKARPNKARSRKARSCTGSHTSGIDQSDRL